MPAPADEADTMAAKMPSAEERPPRPVFARRPKLDAKQTCAEAFALILDECRRQILANRRVVLAGSDAEAVHQLRVGLTRLRAALKAFRPLLVRTDTERLGRLAQNMARAVGELRDCDVLLGELVASGGHVEHADPEELARLKTAVSARRETTRDKVVEALRGDDWAALRLELALWPGTFGHTKAMRRKVGSYADRALARKWNRAAKLARDIEGLAPEQRHDLRKALKQLRYSVEFFGSLYAKGDVRPFVKRLKRLQDVFGYLNDVELTRELKSIAAAGDGIADAAGFVHGWHAACVETAWSEARADWRRLERTRKFWD